MEYSLAKELYGAGFPHEIRKGDLYYWNEKNLMRANIPTVALYPDMVKVPTLSELIEACGKSIHGLSQMKDGVFVDWYASGPIGIDSFSSQFSGSTPEEAVARLWLALNPAPIKKTMK